MKGIPQNWEHWSGSHISLPLCGYRTCLDSDMTGVQVPVWLSVRLWNSFFGSDDQFVVTGYQLILGFLYDIGFV